MVLNGLASVAIGGLEALLSAQAAERRQRIT
jgi:hypothetical protein